MNWTLGVDFGTSNTAAAYRVDGGPAQPVRLTDQAEQMPSAVLALDSGIMVGGAAVRSARLDPQRFEPSPKRRIGEGEILLGAREWSVTQLIAEVLNHVKQKAMWVAGGQPPQQLILTYPQQWAQGRTDLLRRAAAQAGFDPATVRLVTEPIAAATWYAATQPVPAGQCVAVFDFGGGTCDVAVLRSNPQAPGTFSVLAADGIDPLGGELLDLRLLEWTLGQLADGGNQAIVDALSAPANLGAMLTLKEQVRHAKHELGEYESARIPVAVGSTQTVVTITSAEFDRVVGADIDEAVKLTRRALIASGVALADLHALYLTGGSSHLRLVHRKMTELLGRPPATLNDPKLVVAQGALLVPPAALQQPEHSTGVVSVPPSIPLPTGPIIGPRPAAGPPIRVPQPSQQLPRPPAPQTGPFPAPLTGPFPAPQTGPFPAPQTGPPSQTYPMRPAFNGPPAGPPQGSFPSPAAFSPSKGRQRKPRWLIPAIAAVTVAIVATVIILVTGKGSPAVVTDGSTKTSAASTPAGTEASTGPTAGASGGGQFQQCADGSTVAVDATCTTTESGLTCWDESTVRAGNPCPALTGQKALEWVFPVPSTWSRACTVYTDSKYDNEEEVYQCTVDKLPKTYIYLSRWKSADAAKTKFTGLYQTPIDFTLNNDPGTGAAALEWSGQDDSGNDDGTKVDTRVIVYATQPFSMLVYFSDPGGVGKDSLAAWDADQKFQYPTDIAAMGSLPTG